VRLTRTAPLGLRSLPGAALFTAPPTPAQVQLGLALGLAAEILVDAGRERLSLAALLAWLRMPIKLGQILFLTSWERIPLGFATWAFVGNRILERLQSGEQDLPLLEDWNDGEHLWIVDVVAPQGHGAELLRHLKLLLSVNHNLAHYRRRGHSREAPFRAGLVRQYPAWGPQAQSDFMFDQTGHICSSPFDAGWTGGEPGSDPLLKRLPA
jgi:hemolysin-activating ACP:hemolysin acyltransferase